MQSEFVYSDVTMTGDHIEHDYISITEAAQRSGMTVAEIRSNALAGMFWSAETRSGMIVSEPMFNAFMERNGIRPPLRKLQSL